MRSCLPKPYPPIEYNGELLNFFNYKFEVELCRKLCTNPIVAEWYLVRANASQDRSIRRIACMCCNSTGYYRRPIYFNYSFISIPFYHKPLCFICRRNGGVEKYIKEKLCYITFDIDDHIYHREMYKLGKAVLLDKVPKRELKGITGEDGKGWIEILKIMFKFDDMD